MEISFGSRLKSAWNAFFNKDPTRSYRDIGMGYSFRPDRTRFSRGKERSIVTAVYNRIAMDVAAVDMFHVRLDENNRFLATLDSKQVERYRHRKKLFSRLFLCAAALFVAVSVYRVYYYMVNPPGFSCTTEVYISEPSELAPDDPRAVNPYENASVIQWLGYTFRDLRIEFQCFLWDFAENTRTIMSNIFN